MRVMIVLVTLLTGLVCFGQEDLNPGTPADKLAPHLVFLVSDDRNN